MKTKRIKLKNGLKINVFDSSYIGGYKKLTTIIFIHGGAGSLLNWKYQLAYFAREYRTIAYDWRGCGKSDDAKSYTFDDHYSDFLELIKILKVSEKPILIAHCYGCLIARRYINENEVDKFINVSLGVHNGVGLFLRFLLSLPKIIKRPIYHWLLTPRNPIFAKYFIASKKTPLHKIKEALNDNRVPLLDFFVALKTFRKKESLSWMERCQNKLLMISGREDKRMKPRMIRKIRRFIPEAKIEIVQNAGHIIPLENPLDFNNLIEDFIKIDKEC